MIVYLAWPHQKAAAPTTSPSGSTGTVPGSSAFDKQQFSLTDPASIWVVVNKKHALDPPGYTPPDLVVPNVPLRVPGNESMRLRQPAARALEGMFAAAKSDRLDLQISSGYRSYTYQTGTYNSYVKQSGQAYADSISARPGYSEHQTGLAVDIEPVSRQCEIVQCFESTPEGKWLAANSYKYGFLLRYPADKVSVTGYDYEPWHFRYIGVSLAGQMRKTGVETLEEFFGVGGGTSY